MSLRNTLALVSLVLGLVCIGGSMPLALEGCTPAQRAAGPPAVHEVCVLIHGLAPSVTGDAICATADELAPFVAELVAARAAADQASGAPLLAMSVAELPHPKRVRGPPRRRCASWVPVASSSDGSPPDASAASDAETGSGRDAAQH